MTENDKKLMDLLLANKKRYSVMVDNDNVSVYDENEEDFVGSFDKFGYSLLNDIFNYFGIESEQA